MAALALGVAQVGHGTARADHDHAAMVAASSEPSVSVGVAFQAASYETHSYLGNYQGAQPSLSWTSGRFGARASIGLYRLEENGRDLYGFGDLMLGGHAAVIRRGGLDAGVGLHVMLPTGEELDDLGMGHVMVAPAIWAAWRTAPLTLTASTGFARALTALGGSAHDHGPAPLVDPMNMQEVTWSAGADVEVGRGVGLGGRALGAFAVGHGQSRAILGGRVAWSRARMVTGFELQVGVAGDPFTVRGILETALRF